MNKRIITHQKKKVQFCDSENVFAISIVDRMLGCKNYLIIECVKLSARSILDHGIPTFLEKINFKKSEKGHFWDT